MRILNGRLTADELLDADGRIELITWIFAIDRLQRQRQWADALRFRWEPPDDTELVAPRTSDHEPAENVARHPSKTAGGRPRYQPDE